MSSLTSGLTWRLLFVVLSVSFGCWFTIGFSMVTTNAPQSIIVDWIRSVKCSRYGGHFNNYTYPPTFSSNTTSLPINDPFYIWCRQIPEDMESKVLEQNPTLNTIWAAVGCMIGAGALVSIWSANFLLRRFGNKGALLLNNIVGLLGTFLTGLCAPASSYEMLIFGRFLLGMNIGVNVAISPLYITEISPANLRGALCTIPGVFHCVAMLLITFLGLPQILGTPTGWPTLFWLRLIPGLALYATLPFCPESPEYLIIVKDRHVEAKKALQWLRGTKDVQDELVAIQVLKAESKSENASVIELFKDNFLRRVLLVCIFAMLAQQLSGIGAILTYSTAIFATAGLGKLESLYASLGLMTIQVLALFTAVVLTDRAGRRVLLLIGCGGIIATNVGMVLFMSLMKNGCGSCQWGSLVCVLVFIFMMNLGTGSVPWLLVSEMFTQSSRGAAMMVVSGFSWGPFLIVAFLFPILQAIIDQWTFAIFAGMMSLVTIYLCLRLIETKGKTIDEIQGILHQKFA